MTNAIKKERLVKGVTTYFKENLGIILAFAVLYLFLAINPATSEAFLTRQ